MAKKPVKPTIPPPAAMGIDDPHRETFREESRESKAHERREGKRFEAREHDMPRKKF